MDERFKIEDDIGEGELDALPFGAIQLDEAGMVRRFNQYESRRSGLNKSEVIGRNFFTEIAPCTDVRQFRFEFYQGMLRKELDTTFVFHFPFPKPRLVEISLIYSKRANVIWVFIVDMPAPSLEEPPPGSTAS